MKEPAATGHECQNQGASIPISGSHMLQGCNGRRTYGRTKSAGVNAGAGAVMCGMGAPSKSRTLLPLPTCQNKGFPRVFLPPTRRQSWLMSGYQGVILASPMPHRPQAKAAQDGPDTAAKMKEPPVCFRTRAARSRSGSSQASRLKSGAQFRPEAGRRRAATDGSDAAP
jgi:hypothetical protein